MLEIANQQDIEKLKEQFRILVIIFSTNWFEKANIMMQDFQSISKQYQNEIHFIKVNIDSYPELQTKYNVISLPTILVITEKEVKERILVWSKKNVIEVLDENLSQVK